MKKGKRLILLLAATLMLVLAFTVSSFAVTGDVDYDFNQQAKDEYTQPTKTIPTISFTEAWEYGASESGTCTLNYDEELYQAGVLEYAVIDKDEYDNKTSAQKKEYLEKLPNWTTTLPTKVGFYAVRVKFEVQGEEKEFQGTNEDLERFYAAGIKRAYFKKIGDVNYYCYYDSFDGKFTDIEKTHYQYTIYYKWYKDWTKYDTFEITPRKVTSITWHGDPFVYDGTPQAPTAEVANLVAGDNVKVVVKGEDEEPLNTVDAGEDYKACVTALAGDDKDNYVLVTTGDDKTLNLEHEYDISKKPIAITWQKAKDDQSLDLEYTYNGAEQKPYATATDIVDEGVSIVVSAGETPSVDAKDYTATASLEGEKDGNYTLSNTKVAFKIVPAAAVITWSDTTKIYNGKAQTPVATMAGIGTGDSKDKGKTFEVTLDESSFIDAGKYTAKAKSINDYDDAHPGSNYTVAGSDTAETEFTILRKPLKITWTGEQGSSTDFSYVYSGYEQAPTPSLTARETGDPQPMDGLLIGRDSFKLTMETSVRGDATDINYNPNGGGIDAARYTAEVVSIDGRNEKNYILLTRDNRDEYEGFQGRTELINSRTRNFEITKCPVVIEWVKTSSVYNGSVQLPEVKLSVPAGVVPTDLPEPVYSVTKEGSSVDAVNFGTYRVELSFGGTSKNFTFYRAEDKVRNFDITKKALKITANDKSMTYGDDPKNIEYNASYDGLVNGDVNKDMNDDGTPAAGVLSEDVTFTYAYAKNGKPGAYAIIPGDEITAENYEITFVNGKLTVADKVSTIVAKASSKGKKALKFSWNEVNGAASYEVYLGKCNTKKKKYAAKKIATVKGAPLTFTKKKLKSKTAYKFYVVAKDANGNVISQSAIGHVLTGKFKGKYTNAKSMGISANAVTVAKNGTSQLTTTYTKAKKGKKLLCKGHAPLTRFVSDKPEVATVDANGVITGVSTGWCRVYAQGVDGIWSEVEVTVK